MEDLFTYEQSVLDNALMHAVEFKNEFFAELVKEYGKMLDRLRKTAKVSSDTVSLNTGKLDSLDKVLYYDSLTGINNRRFTEDNLKRIIKSLARSGGSLSILKVEIDNFEDYSDTYGQSAAADCLKSVAQTISGCLSRPDDFAARYSDEEFIVVMPDTSENGTGYIGERVLKRVEELHIPFEQKYVTVSVGGTASIVEQLHSVSDFVKKADSALTKSKKQGGLYSFAAFDEQFVI